MSSFGNFLLGVTEGLDRGMEMGERMGDARDRKARRDAGKRDFAIEQMAQTGSDRVRNPGAAADPVKIKPLDPASISAPTAMQQHMPPPRPVRPMPGMTAAAAPVEAPAARMGAEMANYSTAFPGAVPMNYGVTGPYPQQPY